MPRLVLILNLVFVALALNPASTAAQGLIRDAEIEATLRSYTVPILNAAGLTPSDVEIHLINDPSLNAFVANGQKIYLHTGLIIAAKTPGQLKGVIAHETGHIAGAHGVRRAEDFAKAQRPAYLSIGLGIIAIAAGAPEVGAALIAGSQQYAALDFLAHTRVQESSADQAAITYLEKIGESPAGLVEFFNHYRYQEVLSQARRDPYFRSHPLATDRIKALRQRAEETGLMDVPPTAQDQYRFDMMKAKLIGFLEVPAKVYRAYPPSDMGMPARYARAISAYKAVDVARAMREVDHLISVAPENPYFQELKGQILFENARIDASIAPLKTATELAPDAPLIQIAYARSMIARGETGDIEAGEAALRHAIAMDPENAFAWRELAIALERLGRRAEAELATAERAFHIGDIVSAHTFAKRALDELPVRSPLYFRAKDIATITDPRLPENKRAFKRRRGLNLELSVK